MPERRIVRCPKCIAHLLEPSSAPVFECPKCSTLLLAKAAAASRIPVSKQPVSEPETGTPGDSICKDNEKLENHHTHHEEAIAGDPPETERGGALLNEDNSDHEQHTAMHTPFVNRSTTDTTEMLHEEHCDQMAPHQEPPCGDIDEGGMSSKLQSLVVSNSMESVKPSEDDGDHVPSSSSSDSAEFEFPIDRSGAEEDIELEMDNVNDMPSDIATIETPRGFSTSSAGELHEPDMEHQVMEREESFGERAVPMNKRNDPLEQENDGVLVNNNKTDRKASDNVIMDQVSFFNDSNIIQGSAMDDDLSEPQMECLVDKDECRNSAATADQEENDASDETYNALINIRSGILHPERDNRNNISFRYSYSSLESQSHSTHEDSNIDDVDPVPYEICEPDFRFPISSSADASVATCSTPQESCLDDNREQVNPHQAEKQHEPNELMVEETRLDVDSTAAATEASPKKDETEDSEEDASGSVEPYSMSEQAPSPGYNDVANPRPAQVTDKNIQTNGRSVAGVLPFAANNIEKETVTITRKRELGPEIHKCSEQQDIVSASGRDVVQGSLFLEGHDDHLVKGSRTDKIANDQILGTSMMGDKSPQEAHSRDPSAKLFDDEKRKAADLEPTPMETISGRRQISKQTTGSTSEYSLRASPPRGPGDGRPILPFQDTFMFKPHVAAAASSDHILPQPHPSVLPPGRSPSYPRQTHLRSQNTANLPPSQADRLPYAFGPSREAPSPTRDYKLERSLSNFNQMNASISRNGRRSWELGYMDPTRIYGRPPMVGNDGIQKVGGHIHSHEALGVGTHQMSSSSRVVRYSPNWQSEHNRGELPSAGFSASQEMLKTRNHGENLLQSERAKQSFLHGSAPGNYGGHYCSVDPPHQYGCTDGNQEQLNAAAQNQLYHQVPAHALMLPLVSQGHVCYCGHTYVPPVIMLYSACPQHQMHCSHQIECSLCCGQHRPKHGDNDQSYPYHSYQSTASYAGSSDHIETHKNVPNAELKSRDANLVKRRLYPPFPEQRAAPYIICKYCSLILKVPTNISRSNGNIQKMRCSGCRKVSKFHCEKSYSGVEHPQVTSSIQERVIQYNHCASRDNQSSSLSKTPNLRPLSSAQGCHNTKTPTKIQIYEERRKSDSQPSQSIPDYGKTEPDLMISDGSSGRSNISSSISDSSIGQCSFHANIGGKSPRDYEWHQLAHDSGLNSSRINQHTSLRDLFNRKEPAC